MNKPIKILTAAFLLALTSCGGNTQLSEADAKAQVAAMKETINKDDFTTPTSGMTKSETKMSIGDNVLSLTGDLRFNTEKGSRYLYYKNTSLLGNSEICQYEKDGKYYSYASSSGTAAVEEIKTEQEFSAAFEASIESSGADSASLKKKAISYLDTVTNAYDSKTKSDSETNENWVCSFNKISDSAFSFTATVTKNDDSAGATEATTTIEVENYLPKKMSVEGGGTAKGETMKANVSETYTWGSVEYYYPSAE